jgi:uncharacterized protein YjdB
MASRRLLSAVLVATLAGAGPLGAQAVSELYVTPDSLRLSEGDRHGLAVQAFDSTGNVFLGIRYRSANELVARVSPSGAVSAIKAGRTEIVIAAGGKTRTVAVVVSPGAAPLPPPAPAPASNIALLTIEPAGLSLLPTEHARLTVKAARVDGNPLPAGRISWKSGRPEVAMIVDSTGMVAGLSTGQGTIQATAVNGVTASVPVVVSLSEIVLNESRVFLSAGDLDTVWATVPAQGNRRLRSADLQWVTGNPAVAQVSGEGVIRAVGTGQAEISARGFLQERKVVVQVHPDVARFLTRPRLSETIRLPLAASREFRLEVQAADSTPVAGLPVTWSLTDSSVASFDQATGRLTARKAGTTGLNFAVRGFVPKGWIVEVMPGSIGLDRSRVGVRVGDHLGLVASFLDDQGKPLQSAEGVTWRSANGAVAEVSPQGVVEALTPGRAVVSATLPGGQSASALVLVTGDLLVASTRSSRYGLYAISAARPDSFLPVVGDSFANSIDGAYSPDRTRIAFASDRFGQYDIFVAESDGRNPVRLTTDPSVESQPSWSPDGRGLLFVSGRSGSRQVWLMNADGSDQRQITTFPGAADDPTMSPDGRAVAFVGHGTDDGSEVYLIPAEGGVPTAVTATADRRESRPVWLPDGQLAWVVGRRDKRDPDLVVRQPVPGGTPVALVTSDLALADLALARDGSRIAWVASRPSERNRNAVEYTFQWRSLSSGAQTTVRLLPGERIMSPAF